MILNKKVELGLKAIAALRTKHEAARTQDLAVEIGTTVNFLEQIMRSLRVAGLVESLRGPGGGYVVNEEARITAWHVAKALGHDFGTVSFDTDPNSQLLKSITEAFASVQL